MRYPFFDLLRGLSVIGMMFFHANYMLEAIFLQDIIALPDMFWHTLGPTVAHIFILVSGCVFFVASKGKSMRQIIEKSIPRTLRLIVLAVCISYVTFTFIPDQRISWGIIHFFALSSILILAFTKTGAYNFLIGIILLGIGFSFQEFRISSDFLIPLGIPSYDYFAADYYPLLPWFGYILIGHSFAYWLDRYNALSIFSLGQAYYPKWILWVGRHALILYAVHIPLFYALFAWVF